MHSKKIGTQFLTTGFSHFFLDRLITSPLESYRAGSANLPYAQLENGRQGETRGGGTTSFSIKRRELMGYMPGALSEEVNILLIGGDQKVRSAEREPCFS